MNRIIYAVAATCLLTLAACGEEKSVEVVHDVAYFMKGEPEIIISQLVKCRTNPGELEQTPNCENAESAWSNGYLGKFPGTEPIEINRELARRLAEARGQPAPVFEPIIEEPSLK
ncbi:hypothetical protein AGMMS49960_10860 [Betaproteobacteria bacterium]|nr:hypothetical protein AGMMS49543_13080 [Betaproteobacteria bacterium]GHU01169.1 hypothetical protein AGMMS49960_10860 [Betaproteobacteria bacterium]GHU21494.1 hypothetical protein AGMMS50243_19310 [Betaproteobacteria bacterium]